MAAIVLAGGYSERFGRDKLAYPLEGTAVLARVVRTVRRSTPLVFVSVAQASRLRRLRPLVPPETRFVVDRSGTGAAGPGRGLLTAFAAVPEEETLVVAGDMPWVRPAALLALRRAVHAVPGGVAVPFRPTGAVESLVQAHRRPPPPDVRESLLRSRGPLLRPTDFLRLSSGTRLVPVERLTTDPRCFASLNAPGDLAPPAAPDAPSPRTEVLTVPSEGAAWFWSALTSLGEGNPVGASASFEEEAEVYRQLGVPHLERHCLQDAAGALRQAGRSAAGLDRRIGRLRSALALGREAGRRLRRAARPLLA